VSLRTVAALIVCSRLIVWLAGAAGQEWGTRVAGWRAIDPTGITQSHSHLGNLLLAPAVRWDALGYLSIATHGYEHSTTVFYPGYPLAIATLGWVIGSDVLAGLLVSIVAFGVGLWLLHRLTELELGRPIADGVVLLLAFAPLSLFFTALYTESLFFALSVGAIYAARRERWALAGLLVAVATITRVTGIILLAPIVLWQLQHYRRPSRQMAWLLPAPAALAGFMAYMHALGYGWLAPYRNEQSVRHFGGPWTTLFDAIKAFGHGVSATLVGARPLAPSIAGPFSQEFESVVLLVVLALAIAALLATFRRLPLGYGVYAVLALLVAVSTNTGFQPLASVDRYILTLFPLWMAAAAWLSERRLLKPAVVLGAALLAFYSFEFATWAFIA
jgi:hypothetical protein